MSRPLSNSNISFLFDLVVGGVEQTDVSLLSAGHVISPSWSGLPVNEHSTFVRAHLSPL